MAMDQARECSKRIAENPCGGKHQGRRRRHERGGRVHVMLCASPIPAAAPAGRTKRTATRRSKRRAVAPAALPGITRTG